MADVEITVETIDKSSSAITGIRGAILTMNQALQLAGQAYQTVSRIIQQTVGEYIKYADQVRRLSQLNGTSAEQTSRLIQITDDYKISVESLSMATRKLSADGKSLTTDTLAAMSDEYQTLGTSAEKTRFLIENFGRTGTQFAEIMGAGSAAIRSQSAAISGSLILTQKAVDAAREYERQLDDWEDAVMGVKVAIGRELLPALISMANFIKNESIPGWQQFFIWLERTYNSSILFRTALNMATAGLSELAYGVDEVDRAVVHTVPNLNETSQALEDIAKAAEEARKELVDATGWEAQYTAATEAGDRMRMTMDLMGNQLQNLSAEGAQVWQGFLVATGQVAPEAIAQFVKIQAAFQEVRRALEAGIDVNIVIQNLTTTLTGLGVTTGANTEVVPAPTSYWIPDPNNPGHYMVNPNGKAAGGSVFGRYAITGDSLSGRRTGYEELVDFQERRVYSAPQTAAMVPHLASGTMGSAVELSDRTMQMLASLIAQKMGGFV